MAVLVNKIRLGAPDSMFLGAQDLGASMGGTELNYNPTVLQVEIDQSILPVGVFKTKEEISFDVAVLQSQVKLVQTVFGYAQSVQTTAPGTLATATAPVVTHVGTAGAATWVYKIVAFNSAGDGIPSPTGTDTTGNAVLTPGNYEVISWTAVPLAAGYKINRFTSGGTPVTTGIIGIVSASQPLVFNDVGLVATAYTPSGVNPATPNQDQGFFGGSVNIPVTTFDAAIPKNDGSSNHIRLHFNNAASYKAIKMTAARDKITDFSKLSLLAIADLTQAAGAQAGYLIEEY